jgi:quercetin dioxygenase-like cupin family protein
MIAAALTVILATAPIPPPPPPDAPIGIRAEEIVWKEGPPTLPAGSKIAVLEGDPRKEGIFTMRVRVPAGAALAPHWHPRHERVTILAGAAELGFGSAPDSKVTRRYPAGSFYVNPPRTMHYLFFPEETEMQMTGFGPWELLTTDIEARPGEPSTGSVTIRSIKPAAGTELSSTGTIEAVVDYAVQNFRPDTYFLSVQFESTTPNQTFSAERAVTRVPSGPPPRKMLTAASGTQTVPQDLDWVLGNPRLRRPVRLKVYLHEQTSEASSRVIATSDWIQYK